MDDVICAVCEQEFPENAEGAHITTVGGVCVKCVEYLKKCSGVNEGPGEGGV